MTICRLLLTLCSILPAAFAWQTGAAAQTTQSYRMTSDDQLRLRVTEWRAGEGQYSNWAAFDGVYTIDSEGNLSLPVAGILSAKGKTTHELAEQLAKALAEKAGTQTRPSIAVEIAEHAPIYVVGAVQTPGRHPYENGMTAMKAVALAGGFLRGREDNGYFLRDQIKSAGDFRTALTTRRELLMRRARLVAEINGENTFELPAELADMPNAEQARRVELNLLRSRRTEVESRIAAADDVGRLYRQEIKSLEAKIVSQKRQIERAQKELDSATSLMNKGVISNSRQSSYDRDLAASQSILLDLEIALTRARQAVSESERDKASVTNQRNADNQMQLTTLEAALSRASIDMQVAQMLGQQAGYSEQMLRMETASREQADTGRIFRITRDNGSGSQVTFTATDTGALMPHDLVEVVLPLQTTPLASAAPAQSDQSNVPHLAGITIETPGLQAASTPSTTRQ